MTLHKRLLIGAASAAIGLSLSGAANALVVVSDVAADVVFDNSAGPNAATPYLLASEAATAAARTGDIDAGFWSATGVFPSGNLLLDIAITNGTFGEEVTSTDFTLIGTCAATLVRTTGGTKTDSAVQFLVSGLDGCATALNHIEANIPIVMNASGNASATLGVKTESSTAVDGGPLSFAAITRAAALAVTASLASEDNTQAKLLPTPTFTTLNDVGVSPGIAGATANLGGVNIFIDTDVNINLAATPASAAGMVASVDAMLAGSTVGLDDATFGGVTISRPAPAFTATSVDFGTIAPVFDAASTPTPALNPLTIDDVAAGANNTPILASNYAVTLEIDLLAAFTDPADVTLNLASITREGTQLTFPWTSSATQGAMTGSTNVIRIANVGAAATGRVLVQALNSSCGFATPTAIVETSAGIAAGGELLQTSASLEAALGNFCRGDIEVTIEDEADNVTANRFIVNSTPIQGLDAGRADKHAND